MNLERVIANFFNHIHDAQQYELYNEAGLQHELGFFLRSNLDSTYSVQLERNIEVLGVDKSNFHKKEMDLYIFDADKSERYCIEIKFPRKGAFPRRMFQTFEDIYFLEQLRIDAGFKQVRCIFITDQSGFRNGRETNGFYRYFRKDYFIGQPQEEEVPHFLKSEVQSILIKEKHEFVWNTFRDKFHYFVIVF